MSSNVVPFPSCGVSPRDVFRQVVEVVRLRDALDKKQDHEVRTGDHFPSLPPQPGHSRRTKSRARLSIREPLISLPILQFDESALHKQTGNTTCYTLTRGSNAIRSCAVSAIVLPFVRMQDMPNRILELRRAAGLSQEELGFRIGVSKMQISGMERGKREITLTTMRKLADVLGVDTVDILGREDNPTILDDGARRLVARYNSAAPEQRDNLDRVTEALVPLDRRDRSAA